ncbi:MAG: hypothetical protein GY869_09120 [Planctomycetes bacterium]|nr:hypothetical protein [Planctomycetota bacterium]
MASEAELVTRRAESTFSDIWEMRVRIVDIVIRAEKNILRLGRPRDPPPLGALNVGRHRDRGRIHVHTVDLVAIVEINVLRYPNPDIVHIGGQTKEPGVV